MNGTLALWYEGKVAANGAGKAKSPAGPPVIRLHVNLWRDLGKKFNFLDIGFHFEDLADLSRLYLYLPAPIDSTSVFDLSTSLTDPDTLNAVFNDVSEIKSEGDDHFVVEIDGSDRVVHRIDVGEDLSIQPISNIGGPDGSIIALKNVLCQRLNTTSTISRQHYIRIRIFLHDQAQNLFTTEDGATSLGLSLTQDVLETTEFRLNERRSYPHEILKRSKDRHINLRSVHYFLIRSKNHQLGSQHQNFRKIRHLEPDIWTSYLQIGQPPRGKFARKPQADGMIIYQWRALAKNGPECDREGLDDFIAYASFRIARDKILAYVVAVLAIGGVGSALLNVGLAALKAFAEWMSWAPIGSGKSNLAVGTILALLALAPMGFAKLMRWLGKRS